MRNFIIVSVATTLVAAIALGVFDRWVRHDLSNRADVRFSEIRMPLALESDEADEVMQAVEASLAGGGRILGALPDRVEDDLAPRAVFVSAGGPYAGARVHVGVGHGLRTALERALAGFAPEEGFVPRMPWIKLDIVEEVGGVEIHRVRNPVTLTPSLEGIVLDSASHVAFLPEELVARRLIDDSGRVQLGEMRQYIGRTRGGRIDPPDDGNIFFRRFVCASWFRTKGTTSPLYRGNRDPEIVQRSDLLEAAKLGGKYLETARHLDGSFRYLYDPRTDSMPSGYNMLRHAGTLYSMFELFGKTGDQDLLRATVAPLAYMKDYIHTQRSGSEARASVVVRDEVKLGGVALAAIALAERIDVTGDVSDGPLLRSLGRTILAHQLPTGELISKWTYPENETLPFVSQYYPGEAILALMRIYALDADERWVDAAERAARWLITVRDGDVPDDRLNHDHWLLYGLEALHRARPDSMYLDHAERICDAIRSSQNRNPRHPDWLGSYYMPPRGTPTATRTEGLASAYRMLRDNGRPEAADRVLDTICLNVLFQLRTQIRPESAMYYPRPHRAIGGFRKGLEDDGVRIDYVQHNISALLLVYEILREEKRDGIGRRGPTPVLIAETTSAR